MPNSVTAVFNADTGQYVASVDQATGAVTKQGQAVADAKNKILTANKEQIAAAKANGASTEELTRITLKSAESMANVTEKNANRVIAALDRISERQRRVSQELRTLPTVPAGVESHGDDITNKQRASALLRGGGIRAGETFLTQFDLFNKLSTMVFPVLGLGVLVKEGFAAVEAFKQMYDAAKKLPETIREGWEGLNEPILMSADSARKKADELEISLAHLEHRSSAKPDAALEIDEIRIAADNAAAAARSARVAVADLLKQNHSGFVSFALTGQVSTGPVEDEINKRQSAIAQAELEDRDAKRSGSDTPQEQAKREAKMAKMRADDAAWAHKTRTDIQSFAKDGKQDGNIADLVGFEVNRDTQIDGDAQNKRVQADEAAVKTRQDQDKQAEFAKANAEKAKAAARAVAEAARKAAEQQRKQWDEEHDAFVQAGDRTAADEWDFWTKRVYSVQVGSANYKTALDKQTAALTSWRTKDREEADKANAKAQKDQATAWDIDHGAWADAAHRTAADQEEYWEARYLEAVQGSENEKHAWDKIIQARLERTRQAEEADAARNHAGAEKDKQGTAYKEASVALDEQTGRISRQDAAYQRAQIHAEAYRQEVARLQQELERQKGLDPDSAGTVNAQAAIDRAAADRQLQIMQDTASQAAASWQGALKNANAAWVQDSQDSARQVVQLYQTAINGVNENIVQAFMGKHGHTDFKGVGENLAKQGSTMLLQRAEAPFLSALGLTKADGSKGNPLHVIVENAGGLGSMSPSASSIVAGFPGGGSDSSSGGLASLAQMAVSAIPGASWLSSLFGGHRALGGGVRAGMSYDVGEMGRETFVPSSDGTIIPNNKLGGGSVSYNVQVANGVTPEQMKMHVRQALQEFHPKVVADSVMASRAHAARNPSSVR